MRCAKNVLLCKNKSLEVSDGVKTIKSLPSDSMADMLEANPEMRKDYYDHGTFLEVVSNDHSSISRGSKVLVVALEYCPRIAVNDEILYIVNEEDVRLVI